MWDTNVLLKDGKIEGFFENACPKPGEAVYDAAGSYVVPGFIDIHTHGGCGVDVNAASRNDFEKIGHFFATQGTTSWLCSILTDTREQTLKCTGEPQPRQYTLMSAP